MQRLVLFEECSIWLFTGESSLEQVHINFAISNSSAGTGYDNYNFYSIQLSYLMCAFCSGALRPAVPFRFVVTNVKGLGAIGDSVAIVVPSPPLTPLTPLFFSLRLRVRFRLRTAGESVVDRIACDSNMVPIDDEIALREAGARSNSSLFVKCGTMNPLFSTGMGTGSALVVPDFR